MSTPAAFKKAMQQLTTTIVKAEAAPPDKKNLWHDEVRTQLEALLAVHAQLAADSTADTLRHAGWFDQTVARARAVLGDA
ncbi:MAG TPA: hypothetical protein VGM90_00290 [Kofleriaceae bacterium]